MAAVLRLVPPVPDPAPDPAGEGRAAEPAAGQAPAPVLAAPAVDGARTRGGDEAVALTSEAIDLDRELTARFGLESFRPWQREAIEELLHGSGRVLVLAPTGGGKSLCYQFPAAVLGGTTIVISPLIALMEDQVRSLVDRGIPATYLASTVPPDERRQRERDLDAGKYRLVYIAPERLAAPGIVERMARLRPPLVAVDEAHCISQWGHDFRPDYLRIGEVLRALSPPRVMACTATATPAVRTEILEKLGLPEGGPDGSGTKVVLRGFARPNLHLAAIEVDGRSSRRGWMMRAIDQAIGDPRAPRGAAIVYAGTRRSTEEIAAMIAARGLRVAAYHAGLEPEQRSVVSDAFAKRQLDVVVATNAFGMGIDRPDIRCVVHVAPPGSIEAYYQEVGRAGRDGQPAWGLLLSGSNDIGLRRRLIEYGRDGQPVDPAERERQWNLFRDLLRYVEAGSCRHDFILRYFGDEQEILGGCGHCDVCERLEREGGGERSIGEEDALVVRKALAAVARARRRAGMLAVADMLHGVENERQRKLGFTELSTHGLLKEHSREWIVSLLRRLVTAGLVEITPTEFPMPYLSALGAKVMRAEEPVRVLLPPAVVKAPKVRGGARVERDGPARTSAAVAELSSKSAQLFERLRATRLELAKEQRVPAYVVCHDRVLIAIAERRPQTIDEMAQVPGMGPARITAYGDRFLEALEGG